MAILDDPNRSFASSDFVRLELLPKALFNRKSAEGEFYDEFFRAVSHWPSDTNPVVANAYDIAVKFGLAAMDALHIAAALSTGADEFVTTEKRGKPLHRVKDVRVSSIHSDAAP